MKSARIHLESKCDHLKGNWWLWHCKAEMPDGSEVAGTVQADGQGEGIDVDSFVAE